MNRSMSLPVLTAPIEMPWRRLVSVFLEGILLQAAIEPCLSDLFLNSWKRILNRSASTSAMFRFLHV